MQETNKEYGGFLPLELNDTGEYFDNIPSEYISRYNSGTTALIAALKSISAKRLWVPYFYCPLVWQMLREKFTDEYDIVPYYLDENLNPMIDCILTEDDAVIVVNYYGIMDKRIHEWVEGKMNVIIDNAQAFFCEPVIKEGIYNIYSCRKFVGVSDGAYLIAKEQKQLQVEPGSSIDLFGPVYKSVECSTNAVYQESLKCGELLFSETTGMSKLTQAILKNANYQMIIEKRKENFNVLHEAFRNAQEIPWDMSDGVGYCYPLLLNEDYRRKVIDKQIYVPTLWKELIVPEFEGRVEFRMSKNCLCLPIDQRYDENDMNHIVELVNKIMMEKM